MTPLLRRENDGRDTTHTGQVICPPEALLKKVDSSRFSTVLADPPWQFQNRTGKNSTRARSPLPVPNDVLRGNRGLAGQFDYSKYGAPILVGSQRAVGQRSPSYAKLGIPLQDERSLVQGQKGWRT